MAPSDTGVEETCSVPGCSLFWCMQATRAYPKQAGRFQQRLHGLSIPRSIRQRETGTIPKREHPIRKVRTRAGIKLCMWEVVNFYCVRDWVQAEAHATRLDSMKGNPGAELEM